MNKEKFILLFVVFFVTHAIFCQETKTLSTKYSFSIGSLKMADHNLSNQEYSGIVYGLQFSQGQYYKNPKVSWNIHEQIRYSHPLNASKSAYITYLGINVGFGSYYNVNHKNFNFKFGGYLDIYEGAKYQSRNVNNIFSNDLQVQLFANINAQYHYTWNKFGLLLQYQMATPLIGCMFVPEMGQSYYEVYTYFAENLKNMVHLSSFHNRQGYKGNLTLNLIFKGFTLYTGFIHNFDYWHCNNLYFYKKELSGQIGVIVDLEFKCGLTSQPQNSVIVF